LPALRPSTSPYPSGSRRAVGPRTAGRPVGIGAKQRGCDGSWSTAGDHWRMTPPPTPPPFAASHAWETRIRGCSADTQGLGAWNTPHKDQSQANVTAHLASRPPPFPAAAPQLRCPSISADSIRTPPFRNRTTHSTPLQARPQPKTRHNHRCQTAGHVSQWISAAPPSSYSRPLPTPARCATSCVVS